jgi:heptosyltransferase-2
LTPILIVKTAALGDVLRTTSILPGLVERDADARVTWVTSPAAVDLLATHPHVAAIEVADETRDPGLAALTARLASTRWSRVISLDDELSLCRLASRVPADSLSGATLDASGRRVYTPDVAPWFDMGLLSIHGKERADRLKVENTQSQPAIYAAMLGIRMGEPALHLPAATVQRAARFAQDRGLNDMRPLIGLNTGAGGRWASKQLPVDRTVALASRVARALSGRCGFLVLGGESEVERNRAIVAGLEQSTPALRVADAGNDNPLLDFAARVELCDVLVTSDSLALHMGVARKVPLVAFFAPTSAAEIELYGRGEKVVSTAPDYASYLADADNSSLTPERLAAAVLRQLGPPPSARRESR